MTESGLTQSNWRLIDTARRGITAMVRHVIRTTAADVGHTQPLPQARHNHDGAGPPPRLSPVTATDAIHSAYGTWRRPENVIYSYDPTYQPQYQYFSIPSACIGGANTLNEARTAYRSDLAELLNLSLRELPHAVEHLEIAVGHLWLRSKMTSDTPRSEARRLVDSLLVQDGTDECLRFELCPSQDDDEMPVVVVVEPGDGVDTVLNQMTAFDTLWIVYVGNDGHLISLALCEPEADGVGTTSATVEATTVSGVAIASFVAKYTGENNRCVRLR